MHDDVSVSGARVPRTEARLSSSRAELWMRSQSFSIVAPDVCGWPFSPRIASKADVKKDMRKSRPIAAKRMPRWWTGPRAGALFLSGSVVGAGVVYCAYAFKTRVLPDESGGSAGDTLGSYRDALHSGSHAKNTLGDTLPYGSHGPESDLICRSGYTLSYNRRLRQANWVAECLDRESLAKKGDAPSRRDVKFKEDPLVLYHLTVN